jgi:hypothetical protein
MNSQHLFQPNYNYNYFIVLALFLLLPSLFVSALPLFLYFISEIYFMQPLTNKMQADSKFSVV